MAWCSFRPRSQRRVRGGFAPRFPRWALPGHSHHPYCATCRGRSQPPATDLSEQPPAGRRLIPFLTRGFPTAITHTASCEFVSDISFVQAFATIWVRFAGRGGTPAFPGSRGYSHPVPTLHAFCSPFGGGPLHGYMPAGPFIPPLGVRTGRRTWPDGGRVSGGAASGAALRRREGTAGRSRKAPRRCTLPPRRGSMPVMTTVCAPRTWTSPPRTGRMPVLRTAHRSRTPVPTHYSLQPHARPLCRT